jgi:hypothetical protein
MEAKAKIDGNRGRNTGKQKRGQTETEEGIDGS